MSIQIDIKMFLAQLTIFMTVFLWSVGISIGESSVPIYIPVLFFTAIVIGFMPKDFFLLVLLASFFILFSLLQVFQDIVIVNPARWFVGFIMMPFVIFSLVIVLRYFCDGRLSDLFFILKVGVLVLLLVQCVELLLWFVGLYQMEYKYYYFDIPRVSGTFSEPSHLAVAMSPLICLLMLKTNYMKKDRVLRISIWMVCLICPSTTMVAVFFLSSMVGVLRGSAGGDGVKKILFIIFLFLSIFSLIMYIPEINDRVFALISSYRDIENITIQSNISSTLFIKGYQMSLLALTSYPLGVGILNMEYLSPLVSISHLHEILLEKNKNDGTSLLFKTISEFGCIGLIFCVFFVFKMFKLLKGKSEDQVFLGAILLGFSASMIRGSSYFDGFPVVSLSLFFLLLFSNKFYFRDGVFDGKN